MSETMGVTDVVIVVIESEDSLLRCTLRKASAVQFLAEGSDA